MEIMRRRFFFILLSLLHFGCRIGGQMSEMVQNSSSTNHTVVGQQMSSPVIPASTSARHTLQTPSSDQDAFTVTTASMIQSETSQQTADLQHGSEYSQHAASHSDQTSGQSRHTTKYSLSALVQSQLTSEHSQNRVMSSTETFVTSPFPVTKQSTVTSRLETQMASGLSSQTVVTNTESSLREMKEDKSTHWSSSHTTIPIIDHLLTSFSQSTIKAVKSETDQISTSFSQSQSDLKTGSTETVGQSPASVSHHLDSSQSDLKVTETRTAKTVDSTSFHKTEISTNVPTEGSMTNQVTHSIQSSLHQQVQMTQSSGEVLPSITAYSINETPPLPTAKGDSVVSSKTEEIFSSSSEDFWQSSISPSVGHITNVTANQTHSFLSSTAQASDFKETSRLNVTAIITSPSTESLNRESVSSSGVFIVYSTNSQLDMASFSHHSTVLYENSTILINAPAAGTGKLPANASSRYDVSRTLLSETGESSTQLLETSIHKFTTQSKVHVADSHKSEPVVSSLSSTEANIFNSSYRMHPEATETLSLYSQSVIHTVSLPIKVTHTEKDISTIFSTGTQEFVISPSSVDSGLMTSSMLHKNITPTSVYQSENTSLVSQTSDKSVLFTVDLGKMSSVYNMTTTTQKILEIRDVRFLFKFHGDCHVIQNNSLLFNEFLLGLIDLLSNTLTLEKSMINLDKFSCRPLKIYATLMKVSHHNVTKVLTNMIEKNMFIVKINLQGHVVTFDAVYMEEVALLKDNPRIFDLPDEGLDKVDIIVIIVACCICGILLSIGGILCIKECYRRKYAQSFDLMEVPHVNLKLEDFTLTRIPRAKAVYNEDNVTMQSYTDNYGQHVAKGAEDLSKSNNSMHVRMNENTDGIVIGVVGTSKKNGHSNGKKAKWRSSASSENSTVANPSMENLLPSSSDSHTTDGASNPVFIDDECPSCSNDSVSKSS